MHHAPGLEGLLAEGRLSELHAPAVRFLRPRLRRLLAARFLPPSLLDDAMQDTFVRVVRYHAGYAPGRASARTWLMVLARSAVADLARRHHARKTRSLFGRDGELLFDVAATGMPADPGRALAVVEAALAAMSEGHRAAVRLRLEGVGQKEAGERLGLTPGNVGVIFHHFRRRVEAALGR